MKIDISCPNCPSDLFAFEFQWKNDSKYEIECPNGHQFLANILYHDFQKLFEVGLDALTDQYYREALGSFAASYERFMELFVRIVVRANHISEGALNLAWKTVARQSERQLGAFIFLYLLEFGDHPELMAERLTSLRNKVVHQGFFPSREESSKYGKAVLAFIVRVLELLQNSKKHHPELIRSINYYGRSDIGGPTVHYYAYPLIGTNRPITEIKSFEEMLQTKAREKHGVGC